MLESYVTRTHDKASALKFLKQAMNNYGRPKEAVTDRLRSYGAAMRELGNEQRQITGRYENNRAENSLLPFRKRERSMARFRQMRSLQKFAAAHASVHNHFNHDRSLERRSRFKDLRHAALIEWRERWWPRPTRR